MIAEEQRRNVVLGTEWVESQEFYHHFLQSESVLLVLLCSLENAMISDSWEI